MQDGDRLGDLIGVPQRAVLLVERHHPPGRIGARRQTGVLQQQQREQPASLRFGRGQGELAGEADRVHGQVVAPTVPDVVDQRQDAQHHREVARTGEVAVVHGPLGPADPLGHRRLRHEERIGDLPGGQAADGAAA